MADALTQVSSVADTVTTAYQLAADFALRPQLYFDPLSDVQATNQSHNGATVRFIIFDDLAAQATALTETADRDAVAMSESHVDVTLAEYGNSVNTTAKMRGTTMFVPFDPIVANVIGFNAGISIDTLVSTTIFGGTNVKYSGAATTNGTLAANSNLTAANVRRARAFLLDNYAPQIDGGYRAFIHPDIAYDLKTDSAASNWYNPHAYSAPENIWAGEIGRLESVTFTETPRAKLAADVGDGAGGAGTIDAYSTLFAGRQALAKAYSHADGNGPQPRIVPGPVVDKLRRFVPLGWYHLVGYSVYRQASLLRYQSASSIGAN